MSVEYYKKLIIDLRARLDREKESKKRDNERYAGYIKSASSSSEAESRNIGRELQYYDVKENQST